MEEHQPEHEEQPRSRGPEAIAPSTPEDTLVEGTVSGVEGDAVLFRFGDGQVASVPLSELGAAPAVGSTMPLYVEQQQGERWLCSREKGERMAVWARLSHAFDRKETVEGEIVAVVEGGFSVDVGTRAFLPSSQVDLQPGRDGDRYVGQRFLFRVIRFQRNRGNIVLSRRVLLEEARSRTVEKLVVGSAVDGVVRSFMDYGAFIDLGGVQGLLHISDMSWGKVGHPSEILAIGDQVRVKVLKLDSERLKVSLGLRQLQEDPWLEVGRRYVAGREVEGRVVAITDYGLFCELESGVDGLVHTKGSLVPDLGRDVLRRVSIGDRITATVIETDLARKRISLAFRSLGRLQPPAENAPAPTAPPPGTGDPSGQAS